MDQNIVNTISADQFKAFLLEQIKRIVKKDYKTHLRSLDDLRQKQLKVIFENKDKFSPEIINSFIVLDEAFFSDKRKEILDIGNNTSREIENLFENLIININNKENL
ncbi:MAG: hypothetical protein ACO25L_01950 [Candidatus Nanopelagicales bacterium]